MQLGHSISWGSLASLGLAVCVFAWGLQYKLSLYDPPQAASHRIPQAKLLSRNERSGIAESPLVARTKTSTRVSYTVPTAVFFFLLLALSILNPQASGPRRNNARVVSGVFVAVYSISSSFAPRPFSPSCFSPHKFDTSGSSQLAECRVSYSPPAKMSCHIDPAVTRFHLRGAIETCESKPP